MPKVKHRYDVREDCQEVRTLPTGEDAGVIALYSGWGLITSFHNEGYDRVWIYPAEHQAVEALRAWDGVSDPMPGHTVAADNREETTS